MAKITGKDAFLRIRLGGPTPGAWKDAYDLHFISDFTLDLSKDTIEQELVGKTGNFFLPGALSIEGSLTKCRFAASGNAEFIDSIIQSKLIHISGGVKTGYLKFYFKSAMVTSYDVTIGDAGTITEASIDFTVMNPKDAYYSNGIIKA